MTDLILAAIIVLTITAAALFFIRAKKKKRLPKEDPKIALIKANPNTRIISCPECSQQIRFTLPLKSNKAKCKKCLTKFKLDTDVYQNVYITEIKKPDDPGNVSTIEECYQTLEIDAETTPADIRAAYKKKIMEYHPDKVENFGAKIKKAAEDETRRINAAYAMLKKNKCV